MINDSRKSVQCDFDWNVANQKVILHNDESATPIIFMVKALFLQPISMGCLPMHLFFKAFNKPQQLDIQTMLVVIGYQAIQARSMQMK